MKRQTLVRSLVAAGAVALLASGCALRPSEKIEIFEARLSGAQEVPPVNSAGSGQAELQWNTRSNVLSWKVNFTGLSGPVTAAHIHGPAPAGANAGVVIPFMTGMATTLTGQTNLTAQQISDLTAGRWYINIHTATHPGGEIRGQITRRM